jgi:hypothetical protein
MLLEWLSKLYSFLEVVELAFGFRHGGVQVYLTLITDSTPVIKLVLNASGLTIYFASHLKPDIKFKGKRGGCVAQYQWQNFEM